MQIDQYGNAPIHQRSLMPRKRRSLDDYPDAYRTAVAMVGTQGRAEMHVATERAAMARRHDLYRYMALLREEGRRAGGAPVARAMLDTARETTISIVSRNGHYVIVMERNALSVATDGRTSTVAPPHIDSGSKPAAPPTGDVPSWVDEIEKGGS